jgi:hypothetical protein
MRLDAANVRKGIRVQKARATFCAHAGGATSRDSASPCAVTMRKYSPVERKTMAEMKLANQRPPNRTAFAPIAPTTTRRGGARAAQGVGPQGGRRRRSGARQAHAWMKLGSRAAVRRLSQPGGARRGDGTSVVACVCEGSLATARRKSDRGGERRGHAREEATRVAMPAQRGCSAAAGGGASAAGAATQRTRPSRQRVRPPAALPLQRPLRHAGAACAPRPAALGAASANARASPAPAPQACADTAASCRREAAAGGVERC